jgi:hypothetical protein
MVTMDLDRIRHLSEDEVEMYSMGDMSEEETAVAEEHLLACEACRGRVSANDSFVRAMGEAAAQFRADHAVTERSTWHFPRLVFALAFGLALLAAGLSLIVFRNQAPPFAVALEANRGFVLAAAAPAGRPLDLKLDLTTLPEFASYRVEVVDRLGTVVWRGNGRRDASLRIPAQRPGIHFVRVYSPGNDLLREFALDIAGR